MWPGLVSLHLPLTPGRVLYVPCCACVVYLWPCQSTQGGQEGLLEEVAWMGACGRSQRKSMGARGCQGPSVGVPPVSCLCLSP